MPTSIKNERTRAGCWTCRARRKKCDETRPRCNTCYNLGLKCEGYGFRLKWAPRAKQSLNRSRNNKDMIITMSHSSTECQGDTHPNEVLIYLLGQELYKSLTPIQKEIMQDFIDWGAAILIARVKTHYEKYFEVFAGSKALLTSCLAYQITLDSKYAPLAEQYYVRSIEQFRREIANPVCVERESTIYAGLVLCSISMTRGLPWTFHLNGISSILDGRGIAKDQDGHIRDYVFFIGVLDLPTHTLGRRTNHLQIWYRNCRFRFGIEDSLGLPCSLVDLLCLILEPDIEKRLCSWPGEAGTSEQCQIWDLTRYAGIVMAHNLRSEHGLVEESKSDELVAFAVRHIMTTTSRIRAKLGQLSYDPWSGLLFPLVTAGSQPLLLSVADKSLIVESIKDLASGSLERYPYFGKVVSALNELWVNGGGRSLQQVVIDLDMELGLF